MKILYVLEYSAKQDRWQITPIEKALYSNLLIIFNNTGNDFIPVAMSTSLKEIELIADCLLAFKDSLTEQTYTEIEKELDMLLQENQISLVSALSDSL